MSAKWRAMQHRHRYTYSAVIFPQSYLEALNLLPSDISSLKFFSELKNLISLNSIYSQVTGVKRVASAFGELLSNGGDAVVVSEAGRFYLEILFLQNSLPLHRTLVSVLAKTRNFQSVFSSCFRSLCEEYSIEGGKGKGFSVSRVALSLMSCPKLGYFVEIVEECSILIALDVVSGLNAVVLEINSGSRPSPIVMEQCQESLSCLYYLLQRFPSNFIDSKGYQSSLNAEESNIFETVLRVILSILKSSAFSRDCLVAAGVSFCASLQVCMSPQELAFFIVKGFFHQTSCGSFVCCKNEFENSSFSVWYKGDLYSEISGFSILSRLCLLRGILTAVPRTVLNTHFVLSRDALNGSEAQRSSSNFVWTILFDGILPELCNYCENPIDSHFNFHALTVMQICFQQMKTCILSDLAKLSKEYDPFPEDVVTRILRIIWNNLEDPLNQTVKQVHLIFDLLLDVQSTFRSAEGSESFKSFLQKNVSDLLHLGPRCKGRYIPLASLTKRLGAKTILDASPNLLFETVYAYIDDDVCCAVTSFLKCFLECLRDECWDSDGIEKGYIIFRGHCLPPVLYGLVSGVSKLRSNLNTYVLPVVIEVDVDSIFPMLSFISVAQSGEENGLVYPELASANLTLTVDQQVAALVSLLKVSRLLALIEGDIDWYGESSGLQEICGLRQEAFDLFALVSIKGITVKVPVEWLVLALIHVDETLRIDAAESLFLNPKTSSLPSPLELSLMKEAVPLNMRCCSTSFQMKWTSLFRKFFSRVRTALERQFKQGSWQPISGCNSNEMGPDMGTRETVVNRADDLFHFMKWLSSFLFFSCYPSAPYERKIMAMELILIMVNIWPIVPSSQGNCNSISPASCLYPYNKGFILPDSTFLLVGSIIDSWDRLRESSFRILLLFPTPLPGISSQDIVKEVITWAKRLVCSPRVRESDAGALTLRLIFRKYVLELGWIVGVSVNVVCFQSQSELTDRDSHICKSRFPVIEYIHSLIDWLQVAVEEGEKDLSEACKNSFVHGVLLTLRYTFEELDWNSDVVLSSSSEMKHALEKLLELVMRITSLALGVVSADAWYLSEDMDDMVEDDAFFSDIPVEMNMPESSSELQIKNLKPMDNVRQSEQVVMVGCWLAMKEVSLLLGTIIRKVPLPSCNSSDSSKPVEFFCEPADLPVTMGDVMLDLIQLEKLGNHFLEVLLKMKHNGAIDKTRAGFTAVCNRLLCSNNRRLCKMTESWMEQLMERTVAKEQTVDDLLRRSAGIPASFIALFLSEPEGTPKKLLPRALRWLIDVAKMSLHNLTEANSQNGVWYKHLSVKPGQAAAVPREMNGNDMTSKFRDEGLIPTVHAFNVLRAAFNDANLGTDTSGFYAEALIISVCAFSSPHWEIRNSACLAYTALVRRMIGFLNVRKRESSRRALTGLEFFHRYPALHPFLFNELKIATELLGDGSTKHTESSMAKVVHPSLCPVLILLSRFKPSAISGDTEDALDPFLFMPFIRRCSTQNNLRVRVLASKALAGLVSNEKLPSVLFNIAHELPCPRNQMTCSFVSSSPINTSMETPFASSNSIHGTLLQLNSLLDTNCRNLADVSKKDQILNDLIQVLGACSWIGSPRLCPCPILNSSYLRVLDHMLGIARACGISGHVGTLRSLLLELSSECLDTEVCGPVFYDPTKPELRRQAVVSYLNCVFQASKEAAEEFFQMPQSFQPPDLKVPETENSVSGLLERLIFSLSDIMYEVRVATLKWLLHFLKSTGSSGTKDRSCSDVYIIQQWAKSNLQPMLMQLLATEDNPKCIRYILRILFSWNLLQFQKAGSQQCMETIYVGGMDCDSVFQFWDRLISLNKVATHTKIREALICCMGICVKRFTGLFMSFILLDVQGKSIANSSKIDQSERLAHIYRCISSFINLIKQHSASSAPVNMRKAAMESMVASGLLEEAQCISSFVYNTQIPFKEPVSCFEPLEAVNMYAHKILDLWFTCISLLEDEDVGLRQSLAMDIQKCFTSKGSGRSNWTGNVPIQVEKVIESSFEFLSSIFGHWLEYFDYLSQWVLNTANYVVTRGDLVRRVFDKEIDNHHEEKLLICQICCFHLEKLPLSKSWAAGLSDRHGIKAFLQKWRMRFYHQLISFANDYLGMEGGVDWIGGVGNHKDAFTSVYAYLLGLYALLRCLEETESMPLLSHLIELGEIIRPFLRNPLISNLYLLVVQSHEKLLGIAVDPLGPKSRGESSIWEGFDPYFLLR